MNPFYDEISQKFHEKSTNEESTIKIHSIAIVPFNTLSRQKDVKIFVVFMKDLKIQLKKQKSNTVTDSKSVVSSEYHDFWTYFSKRKKTSYHLIENTIIASN
jgi:TolB-like protein